jgi:hypothetical protein
VSWLLRDGDVLAAIETRRRGWADCLNGAVLIHGPALVQTVTTPVSLDVAWCDSQLQVRRIGALRPYRLARPQVRPGCLVLASPGSFDRWHLRVGDRLEIREV